MPPRILVLYHSSELLALVCRLVSDDVYQFLVRPCSVHSLADGWRLKPDAIILDDPADQPHLAQAIRHQLMQHCLTRPTPVIVLSHSLNRELRAWLRSTGAYFLPTPCPIDDVLCAVQRAVCTPVEPPAWSRYESVGGWL